MMHAGVWACCHDKTKTSGRNNLKLGTLVDVDTVLISGSKGKASG